MKKHLYKIDQYGVRNYHLITLAVMGLGLLYSAIALLAVALLHFEAAPLAPISAPTGMPFGPCK